MDNENRGICYIPKAYQSQNASPHPHRDLSITVISPERAHRTMHFLPILTTPTIVSRHEFRMQDVVHLVKWQS